MPKHKVIRITVPLLILAGLVFVFSQSKAEKKSASPSKNPTSCRKKASPCPQNRSDLELINLSNQFS